MSGQETEQDVVPPDDDEERAEQAAHEEAGEGAEERLELTSFVFDKSRKEVLECPGGQAPTERVTDKAGKTVWSTFDAEACAACPLAGQCPTRCRKDGTRTLRHRPSKVATAFRQQEQRGSAFKQAYKIRSGIESANAELKGRHGAGRLRVRGRERVAQRMLTKGLAVNASGRASTTSPAWSPPLPTASQPPPPLHKLRHLLKDAMAHHGSRLAKLLGGALTPQPTGA